MGVGARAWAAHANANEALAAFAPAAAAALALGAAALPAAQLAAAVLLLRVVHWGCYLAALDAPRSLAAGAAACATAGLYALSLWPAPAVKALGLA